MNVLMSDQTYKNINIEDPTLFLRNDAKGFQIKATRTVICSS